MRVLVTGGSGFLGINIVRYLLARGEEVTSFDFSEFHYPEKEKIRIVRGDIRDKVFVEKVSSFFCRKHIFCHSFTRTAP